MFGGFKFRNINCLEDTARQVRAGGRDIRPPPAVRLHGLGRDQVLHPGTQSKHGQTLKCVLGVLKYAEANIVRNKKMYLFFL